MNILLITSTIQPRAGVHALAHANTAARLADYERAFSHYCEALNSGAYDAMSYVDNSGYDLSSIRRIAEAQGVSGKIEFISYVATTPPQNNRLYLEAHLIEHFIENSQLLRRNPNALIWKVTGRYRIVNVAEVIKACQAHGGHELFINLRNHPYSVADFYLVGFSTNAFRKLFSERRRTYEGLRDGELILRQHLEDPSLELGSVVKRLPVTPRILGTRGFDGATYGGWKDSAKYYVRSLANSLAPALWI